MKTTKSAPSKKRQSALKNWKEYKDFYAAQSNREFIASENARLNRFEARFNLASNFSGIQAKGISEATLRGYQSGFQLLLSYSAAELLSGVIDKKITDWEILNKTLADKLRKTLKSYKNSDHSDDAGSKDIGNILGSAELQKRFNAFLAEEHNDIRVVATAMRVAMAHGPFNPNAFDLTTEKDCKNVDELSKKLLMACQNEFNEWFKEKKIAAKSL